MPAAAAPAVLDPTPSELEARALFRAALGRFDPDGPVLLLSHNDADGLSALAILARAFEAAGRTARLRVIGRGESAWSEQIRQEFSGEDFAGVIAADLGVRPGAILPGVRTVVIDHHAPQAETSDEADVITGWAMRPIPTSSLLAYWCAAELADTTPLLWLAAIGLIGDMAENAGFHEMSEARARYGVTALRDAVALVNAPRRTGLGDASPALALLMKGEGPKDVTSGRFSETDQLRAAREEVKCELDAARRIGPKVRNGVALLRFSSPCQIHPLIAQTWRGRLKGEVVLAANTGYRPGWVHFAVRSARDIDLLAFLAEHRPPGADDNYGSGHRAATGGALRPAEWNAFISELGFPEEQLPL